MTWGLIGLVLILLVFWGYKYLNPVVNKTPADSPVDLGNIDEISTVNIALEEYLGSFNVYVVKQVYFIDGQEKVIQEKTYNTGTNNERLKRAEMFFKLTCQNISTQYSLNTSAIKHNFLLSLTLIEKQNGIDKVTILKQANNKTLEDML